MSALKGKDNVFFTEKNPVPFSSSFPSNSKTSKHSEEGDKMKIKLMEKWNNFKFGE